jgi:tetratricopeptide (TPR) repeat protein
VTQTAEELHRRAVEQSIQGRHGPALRALAQAEGRTGDVNLLARIAGTRAVILHRTGDPSGAEALCRRALAASELTPHTKAILYGQLGALANYGGRLDDADGWLSKAIESLAEDRVAAARVRMNRSLVSMQRRRLADAVADLEEASDAFASNSLPTEEAHARHNLGYAALLAGDLVFALKAMTDAREAAATSPVAASIGDVDRAEVLRDAGLTTEAERILAHAAATFGVNRMPQARAEAEFQLARSLLAHDPEAAGRVAASARRRLQALGNDAWATRAEAIRLRAVLSAGAVTYTGGRVRHSPRVPTDGEVDGVADALDRHAFRSEATALRLSRELWRARRQFDPAGPRRVVRLPSSAAMDVRLMAHEVRAARATAAGHNGEARRHAAGGLDVLADWQRSFGSLDLQTSVTMHGASLVYAGLDAAIRSRRAEAVFEWSERARHLSQQVVPLRPPPDPALATELAELRMLRAADPTGDWLTDPRAAALRDAARQRQWSGTGSAEIQERIRLEEFRETLDAETALIAFVYPGGRLSALVVTGDRVVVLPIDGWPTVQNALSGLRADLDMSASLRNGPMADVVRRSLDARLEDLSAALLEAPASAAGTRRLIITVPGVLNGIPWAMLPAMRGRSFTLAVSATRWASLRGVAGNAPATAGFAVGPRVRRGDEEADTASSSWTVSRTIRGADATVDAVTDLASAVDLLHVAAHGRHAIDNPQFSGLELADGALFGYDIDRMPRVPRTVVLSACELGRSSVRWGEEAIGMTRIWLHAGTRAVVASPVVVADDVACELLAAMHEGLAAGQSPSEALAAASARTGIVAPFQAHGAGF